MGDDSDEALMLRYRDGDAAAFATLYQRHKGGLYRYFRRQAGPVADELFQDVWLRVIEARIRYQVRARFSTWLYQIAHNRLVDHWRYRGRRPQSTATDPETLADGRTPALVAEQRERLLRAHQVLAGLPAEQSEAFLLRAEAGLGPTEIAEITGVPRETAKSRLRYAMNAMRAELGEPS
ncbi:MAG: sigma-70 family RNA polymerase sigma factor [Gammaproteobacteria bacterium]|nr:sigma-70 family RNA polymerase sigma factor [Gammaproteobacteria bacterium]